MKTDYIDRMRITADKIGELPTTGMIEAERAHTILWEALAVMMEAIDESTEQIVIANRIINGCDLSGIEPVREVTPRNHLRLIKCGRHQEAN